MPLTIVLGARTTGTQQKAKQNKKLTNKIPTTPWKKSNFSRSSNIDPGVTCDPNSVYDLDFCVILGRSPSQARSTSMWSIETTYCTNKEKAIETMYCTKKKKAMFCFRQECEEIIFSVKSMPFSIQKAKKRYMQKSHTYMCVCFL